VTTPASPLTDLMGALPKPAVERLARAEAWSRDPTELVDAFEATVESFSSYDNLAPFAGAKQLLYAAGWDKSETVAAALEGRSSGWDVVGDDELSFHYVDREIVPAAGRARRGVVKIDLVLVTKTKRRLILGEIKTTTDTDAFYALLQVLEGAAQLSGPTQRARLRLWCAARHCFVADRPPHLAVLLVDHKKVGTKPRLLSAAQAIAAKVARDPRVRPHVGRIAFLDVATCGDQPVRITRL
jgi:hypothetical protein